MIDIPETGYGSWAEHATRLEERRAANTTGGGVHCGCFGYTCVHVKEWAARTRMVVRDKNNPSSGQRAAAARG